MKKSLAILGLFWVFLIIHGNSFGQILAAPALVQGRVSDGNGSPITGARIAVFPMDVAVSGPLPTAKTDEHGFFRMSSPPFGRTRFCAVKDSAGYPDTNLLLFASGNDQMPELALTPGAHVKVEIQLGPPDGIVELTGIDAETRAPVKNFRLTLRRHEPEAMFSTSVSGNGSLPLALPPVPIEMFASAPGYQQWRYADPESGSNKLVLGRSDHKAITIEFRKANRSQTGVPTIASGDERAEVSLRRAGPLRKNLAHALVSAPKAAQFFFDSLVSAVEVIDPSLAE